MRDNVKWPLWSRRNHDLPIDLRFRINRKRQANFLDPDGTRTDLMEPYTIDSKATASSTRRRRNRYTVSG
jgi:hypothetical protein